MIVGVCLLVVYLPVLTTRYAFADDYRLLSPQWTGFARADIGDGRPLFSLGVSIAYRLAGGIRGVAALRLLSVLAIVLAAGALVVQLGAWGWGRLARVGVAVSVGAAPTFQALASQGFNFVAPWALVLALLAAWVVERSGGAWLAGALLTASVVMYQSATMLYWVVPLVLTVGSGQDLRELGRRYRMAAVPGAAAMTVGFLAWRLGGLFFPRAAARQHMSFDLANKASWYWSTMLPRAVDVFSFTGRTVVVVAVLTVVALGVFVAVKGSWSQRAFIALLSLALVVVAAAPSLATGETWASYRSMVALMPYLLVLTALALRALSRAVLGPRGSMPALAVLGALFAVALGVRASDTVANEVARPQRRELGVVRSVLAAVPAGATIYVVPASWRDTLAHTVSYDEFGLPTSEHSGEIEPIFYRAAGELRPQWRGSVVVVPSAAAAPAGAKVIDMGAVLRSARKHDG